MACLAVLLIFSVATRLCHGYGHADVWSTYANDGATDRLQYRGAYNPEGTATQDRVIEVNQWTTYQEVEGFGAALSNSAAYLIYNHPNRDWLLEDLFDPEKGAGISYIRLVMGGSDFMAVPPYTYDDMPWGQTDYDLWHFSIDKDRAFVLPLLKEIKSRYPNVKILATPWSAPAWMKDTQLLNFGQLKTDHATFQVYADYFVKFIQAYEAEGITIDAITIQNEPEHEAFTYPSMKQVWWDQSNFVGYHLGPTFREKGIKTDILIWDHNWDMTWYPLAILNEPLARQYITGSAFHCYAGNPEAIQEVHDRHPDKKIYFTECSGGRWSTAFDGNLWWNANNVFVKQLRHWSRSVLFWNLALDENDGPKVDVGGCMDCRGVVTITTDKQYTREVEYYNLAHFAKFVPQGSVRIQSSEPDYDSDFINVAFRKPNGDIVVIVANGWNNGWKNFSVKVGNQYYNFGNIRHTELVTMVIRQT